MWSSTLAAVSNLTIELCLVYGFLMDQCSGDDIDDSASVFYSRVLLHLAQIFTDSAMQLRHLAVSFGCIKLFLFGRMYAL